MNSFNGYTAHNWDGLHESYILTIPRYSIHLQVWGLLKNDIHDHTVNKVKMNGSTAGLVGVE